MGTLDDAIREHLELKRKHGADEQELKELEDSAFGLPERPGTEEGSSPAPAEASLADEAQVPDESDATTLMKSEAAERADAVEIGADQVEEPAEPAAEEEMTPAERARQEHPNLQDTVSHEPVPGPSPVQSTEEQDALEISLFESEDQEEDFDIGDVDLDLDEDEEFEDDSEEIETLPEESAREHRLVDSGPAVVDPDPTGESAIDQPPGPADVEEDEDEPQSQPLVDPDPTDEGHDVLEDTPEFLRDAPESDEAWFEQDEPKDFDFDD